MSVASQFCFTIWEKWRLDTDGRRLRSHGRERILRKDLRRKRKDKKTGDVEPLRSPGEKSRMCVGCLFL